MPIFNSGGGKSSPSIIEYNFSESKEITLSEVAQVVVPAALPKVQRSFWVYFTHATLLAGRDDMVGAMLLPPKTSFQHSDNGGSESAWWAKCEKAGESGKALIQIKANISEESSDAPVEPPPELNFEYIAGIVRTAGDKVFLRYLGTSAQETIGITNNTFNYINSSVPIDYAYVTCTIRESVSHPENAKWNFENMVNIVAGETIFYTWNVGQFPYLSVFFSQGEWMADAVILVSGNNLTFSEYLEY